jgi:hypothetical protein
MLGQRKLSDDEQAYLKELTTFSMARLEREPRLLEQEEAKAARELADLAQRNYGVFMQSQACVRDLAASVRARARGRAGVNMADVHARS